MGGRARKKVCPDWSGPCPTLTAAMSAKKRLLIGWRWPGGLGVDKTTHSPPFFPGRSLRKRRRRGKRRRRRRSRSRRRRSGSGKGAEEEEVEDLGRLCKTRPDKDCPINTQVPTQPAQPPFPTSFAPSPLPPPPAGNSSLAGDLH